MRAGGVVAVALGALLVPAAAAAVVDRGGGTDAVLTSEERVDPVYGQGIARVDGGWIMSGRSTLGRLDDALVETLRVGSVIPPDWVARGFDHVGDPDVYAGFLYAPLEQPDYERGEQATARYDPVTLAFVDATTVPQHENSFVTVDGDGVAYSMDRFGGDALVRYDVDAGWKPLDPIRLSRTVERVQGGDVVGGIAWLSTDDDDNGIYRVDLASGKVDQVGSAGHLDGEGEGIDATELTSGTIHTLTVDAAITPVWLGHFEVGEPAGSAPPTTAARREDDAVDSSWPPILVALVLLVGTGAVVAGVVVVRQARTAARTGRTRPE